MRARSTLIPTPPAAAISEVVQVTPAAPMSFIATIAPDLAGYRRNADRVAVTANAAHHAGEEVARVGIRERAEAERIAGGDRARAAGEDVADDAADAGRGALVRLDLGRVVVTLHLHHD